MQFERLQAILNRLEGLDPSARTCWETLPAPEEPVTVTLGPNEVFLVWHWRTEWVPCGTIAASTRLWNRAVVDDYIQRDGHVPSRLVWMAAGDPETGPRSADLGRCVLEPVAHEAPDGVSDAWGRRLSRSQRPLWCESAEALSIPRWLWNLTAGTSLVGEA